MNESRRVKFATVKVGWLPEKKFSHTQARTPSLSTQWLLSRHNTRTTNYSTKMVRTPSLSFFVALACVFLVLVSSPAAAAGRSPPLPQSQANPKTFTAPSWSMATGPSAAPPNLRPIVGIFTLANSDKPTETASTIPATYVKWSAPTPTNTKRHDSELEGAHVLQERKK